MNIWRKRELTDDMTPECYIVTVVSQLPSLLSRDMSDVQGLLCLRLSIWLCVLKPLSWAPCRWWPGAPYLGIIKTINTISTIPSKIKSQQDKKRVNWLNLTRTSPIQTRLGIFKWIWSSYLSKSNIMKHYYNHHFMDSKY